MWIDKVVFFVGLIIAIAIIWYEFSRIKKSHDAETKNLHNQISELKEKNREEQDKLFLAHEKEKQEIVVNELIYLLKCEKHEAKNHYLALRETHYIFDFFEAGTETKRLAVLNIAIKRYNDEKEKRDD